MSERTLTEGCSRDAINRHMAFGRDAPEYRLTEDMLSFECLRCRRPLSASQTIVARTPREVAYLCPNDEAVLATIHDDAYSFHDGGLTIRNG
jgi:hypothetical protein